jgi:phage gp16-like protein
LTCTKLVDAQGIAMNHIAAIHTLKTKLGMQDADYRHVLQSVTGKASCKAMNATELARLRDHFDGLAKAHGIATVPSGAWRVGSVKAGNAAAAARPLERKVWALWGALGKAGKLDKPGPMGLRSFVQRQCDVTDVRFCSDAQLHSLVESLKLWGGREGVHVAHKSGSKGV